MDWREAYYDHLMRWQYGDEYLSYDDACNMIEMTADELEEYDEDFYPAVEVCELLYAMPIEPHSFECGVMVMPIENEDGEVVSYQRMPVLEFVVLEKTYERDVEELAEMWFDFDATWPQLGFLNIWARQNGVDAFKFGDKDAGRAFLVWAEQCLHIKNGADS